MFLIKEKQVALLAGGNGQPNVEVYSPTGSCNYALAPLPTTGTNFGIILAYINQVIFACAGPYNKICWKYKLHLTAGLSTQQQSLPMITAQLQLTITSCTL